MLEKTILLIFGEMRYAGRYAERNLIIEGDKKSEQFIRQGSCGQNKDCENEKQMSVFPKYLSFIGNLVFLSIRNIIRNLRKNLRIASV